MLALSHFRAAQRGRRSTDATGGVRGRYRNPGPMRRGGRAAAAAIVLHLAFLMLAAGIAPARAAVAQVTSVTATVTGPGIITLTWKTAPGHLTGYEVMERTKCGDSRVLWSRDKGRISHWHHTGLEAGRCYRFGIRAWYQGAGDGCIFACRTDGRYVEITMPQKQ